MDRELRPLGDDVEVLVGDHGGDLDDLVAVGQQPGHLQIDPDQILVIAHGIS